MSYTQCQHWEWQWRPAMSSSKIYCRMELSRNLLTGCKLERNFMIYWGIPLAKNGTILKMIKRNDPLVSQFIATINSINIISLLWNSTALPEKIVLNHFFLCFLFLTQNLYEVWTYHSFVRWRKTLIYSTINYWLQFSCFIHKILRLRVEDSIAPRGWFWLVKSSSFSWKTVCR